MFRVSNQSTLSLCRPLPRAHEEAVSAEEATSASLHSEKEMLLILWPNLKCNHVCCCYEERF